MDLCTKFVVILLYTSALVVLIAIISNRRYWYTLQSYNFKSFDAYIYITDIYNTDYIYIIYILHTHIYTRVSVRESIAIILLALYMCVCICVYLNYIINNLNTHTYIHAYIHTHRYC